MRFKFDFDSISLEFIDTLQLFDVFEFLTAIAMNKKVLLIIEKWIFVPADATYRATSFILHKLD